MSRHSKLTPSPYPLVSLLSLAAAAVLTFGLSGCGQTAAPEAGKTPPRTVLVASALPAAATGPEFIGEVRAAQRAELAFALPGLVDQVLVEAGDRVRRGQLLATLEAAPGQAQLNAAQAEIQRLQAGLDEARRKQERLRAARERKAASEAEWTAAQTELGMAEAALAAARAQREGQAWNRARAELRAPFDGVVASRQLEIGQAVGSGLPVIAIDGAGRELWVTLPAGLPALAVGQRARLATPQGELDSRLLRLGSRLEAGGAQRAVLALPEQWRVGDTLAVRLLPGQARPASVQIPLRAVQGAADQAASVFRLKADGRTVEQVAVGLGATRGEQVEVLAGLQAGDRVVVAGGHSLAAGALVKPVTALR
ncbi:efflux RND transporter periplasmic adaptor subunit [Roseateles sp. DAIF2]|uniref:efflux RND transporter periplasmic adaptor subunit n=1 Tax=Roseateles sp. DAIF2 TaxID=2714952 RepID=UPI0018A27C8A|nr:efflux RND transporter periplasmic adaptor subunit [Roseateles sp. DAIF2]QPF75408.1 efflux RND transporter periplasmic adaptor subunit [Roseateles sp. DAIF2]